MSRKRTTDVEQLLAATWSDELAAQVADRVESERSIRGYLVRAVQPDAVTQLGPGDVVWEAILDALHAETGVNVDHARHHGIYQACQDVLRELARRWQDGGSLPAVVPTDEAEAARLLRNLTGKAAEAAGCETDESDPWEPLRTGGCMRVDDAGLQWYLDTYAAHGIEPEERRAIHRLLELATDDYSAL